MIAEWVQIRGASLQYTIERSPFRENLLLYIGCSVGAHVGQGISLCILDDKTTFPKQTVVVRVRDDIISWPSLWECEGYESFPR